MDAASWGAGPEDQSLPTIRRARRLNIVLVCVVLMGSFLIGFLAHLSLAQWWQAVLHLCLAVGSAILFAMGVARLSRPGVSGRWPAGLCR